MTGSSTAPDHAVPEDVVLAGLRPPFGIPPAEIRAAVAASGRFLVVLDDDPTGTQSVADVPVLTTWGAEDLRWGFRQASRTFYVLTNTRSLGPQAMRTRNEEIVATLAAVAREENVRFVLASRSDSTLRGHYPLEVDVLCAALANAGEMAVNGVLLAPAYVDAGRFTVGSVHWMRVPEGLLPVGLSEFARDPTFGYNASDLRDYVAEKTGGRWSRDQVVQISLADIRTGGPEAVAALLEGLSGGRPAVADAVTDDDLRVVALGALRAEAAGGRFIYRVGPSFVRARAGLEARPPLSHEELVALLARGPRPSGHGLIVVGSHVPRTTRQLNALLETSDISRVELDVNRALAPDRGDHAIAEATEKVTVALSGSDVVLCTSRQLVVGDGPEQSLSIAHTVSSALVSIVSSVMAETPPAWVISKGGITSSDIATEALGIGRAWARGTLLPGIISLWEPVNGPYVGVPYIVFAGNVGDDSALAIVVKNLRSARRGENG